MMTMRHVAWSALLVGMASVVQAGELRGRVTSESKGVAGATVAAVPFTSSLDESRRQAKGGEAPKPLATATTKPDGSYVLTVPPPAIGASGLFRLQVTGKGLAAWQLDDLYDAAESTEAGDAAVPKAAVLAGKVVDKKGGPMVGATVTLTSSRGGPFFGGGGSGAIVPATTTTGADGTFRFAEAAPNRNEVRVESPGFAFAEARDLVAGAVRRPLTLVLGRSLSGTVVTEGKKPVGGALVRFETGRGSSRFAESRPDGTFLLDGLPPEGGTLVADAGDAGRGSLVLEAGVGKGTVVLAPTAAVSGRVVEMSNGAPVPRVRVTASAEGAVFVARSGPDGRYEIRGLPARSYRLGADNPAFVPWSRDGVTVAPAARAVRDVILTRAATLVGRVVDEAGLPVDGATGVLTPSGETGTRGFFRRIGVSNEGAFRTGPDGTFKATRIAPGPNQTLTIRHQDFEARTLGGVSVQASSPTRLNVVLRRGSTVRGIVKDERGQPIAGADVALMRDFRMQSRRGAMDMTMISNLGRPGLKTGTDGRFEAKGLSAGDYSLTVSLRGYGRERVDPVKIVEDRSPEPIEVVLRSGVSISGAVRDKSGNGVAGQRVAARSASAPAGRGAGPFGGPMTDEPTGPDGAFVIEGVMPGETYELQVLGDAGLGPRKSGVTAPAEGVELIASTRGGIKGVVRDADTGRPLRDFEVTYRASRQGGGMQMRFGFGGRGGRGPDQPTTFHVDDGAFLLEEVPAGKWDVDVKADGYQEGHAGGVAVDESAVAENVEVRLSKGGVISGRVLDARSGGPIRDAALRADVSGGAGPVIRMGPGVDDQRHASSDADGKFEITGLAPGTYKITATHSEWSEASESVELKTAAATLDIKMSLGASVVGAVMGAGQRPVAGASVSIAAAGGGMGPFGSDEQTTVADPGGRFRFDRLTPGRYTVIATLRSESSPPAEVVVQAGDGDRSVTLNLRTGATVRGAVTGLSEAQRVNVNVSASGPEEYFASLRTDAAGNFEFTGVPVGAINLRANAGDFVTGSRSAASQVVVPEGQLEVAAEITFEEGFRLDGHVSRGGKPVGDAMVFASPEGGGGGRGQRSASGRTDESGAFALEGLAAGTYMVMASPQSGGSAIRKSVTLSGDMSVDLEAPPARLAGTVVEQGTSRPLGDAEVRLEDPKPGAGRGGMMMAQTSDSSGRFVFDGVDPQPYRLAVQKAAYQAETRDVTAAEDTDVVVELKRAEGIGVTARDGIYQTPLRGLFVRIADGAGATAFSGSVGLDSDGHGEIPSVRPGSYQLRASAQGYAPVGPVTINVPSTTVNLTLTPGGTLELQVGPETMGRPNPLAHITLASGAPYVPGMFGPDGSLRLSPGVRRMENMAPGSYVITVDGGGARKAFDITEGGTASVVLP